MEPQKTAKSGPEEKFSLSQLDRKEFAEAVSGFCPVSRAFTIPEESTNSNSSEAGSSTKDLEVVLGEGEEIEA